MLKEKKEKGEEVFFIYLPEIFSKAQLNANLTNSNKIQNNFGIYFENICI